MIAATLMQQLMHLDEFLKCLLDKPLPMYNGVISLLHLNNLLEHPLLLQVMILLIDNLLNELIRSAQKHHILIIHRFPIIFQIVKERIHLI